MDMKESEDGNPDELETWYRDFLKSAESDDAPPGTSCSLVAGETDQPVTSTVPDLQSSNSAPAESDPAAQDLHEPLQHYEFPQLTDASEKSLSTLSDIELENALRDLCERRDQDGRPVPYTEIRQELCEISQVMNQRGVRPPSFRPKTTPRMAPSRTKYCDEDNLILVAPTKTRKSSGVEIEIPVTADLRAVMDRAAAISKKWGCVCPYIIHTRQGTPYTRSGVYSAFARAGGRVGIKGADPKSIRKFAAIRRSAPATTWRRSRTGSDIPISQQRKGTSRTRRDGSQWFDSNCLSDPAQSAKW